jgi:hypothetical protein
MWREETGKKMTKRIEVARAPEPLEKYLEHFDPLFGKSNQREGFRRYVEGLLLPSERHKTLTGLVNTEPIVGDEPRGCNGFSRSRIGMSARFRPSDSGCCVKIQRRLPTRREC